MILMKYKPFNASVFLIVCFQLCNINSHAQIEWKEYPHPIKDELKNKVRFGYLTVPETRSAENQKTLRIAFCLLKSTSKNPLKDAIIYLPGGPGGSYTQAASFYLNIPAVKRMLESRDVILFDPRGCGNSEPQLCELLENPEVANANFSGISVQESLKVLAEAMEKCKQNFVSQGINVESYGSSDIANDIEDLRIALGYEKWNIRGHSYGTRYAQSVIRQYPQHVRSAVLSGLVPSNTHYEDDNFYGLVHALRLVINQCEADSACKQAYPQLENDLITLMDRIKKEPIILPNGASNLLPKSSLVLNTNIILSGIFQAMYNRTGIEMIPLLIHTVSQGNDWIAEPMVLSLAGNISNQDMLHVIRCNDNPGVIFAPKPVVNDKLINILYPYWIGDQTMPEIALCETIGISLDSSEQVPIRSNTPMLLFSGEFDPVTPSYNTDSVAKYLVNATTFVVRGRGHDASVPVQDIIADFFINPEVKPDLSTLDKIEPVKFLSNVSLNKGVSAISVRIAKDNYLNLIIIGGLILVLILSGLLFYPIQWLIYRLNKNENIRSIKQLLPVWIVPFLSFLFLLFSLFAFKDALDTHPNLLAFGVPKQWASIFYIPWLLILALVASGILSRQIWNKQTKFSVRLFWLISWLGGVNLVMFLFYWKII